MKGIQKIITNLTVFFVCVAVILLLFVGIQMLRNSGDHALSVKPTDAVRVATYNVHYIRAGAQTGDWSVGDWERRKQPLSDAVNHTDTDIIAFQEMESFARGQDVENLTLEWLQEQHSEYTAAAVGDPDLFPSTQPIFYRNNMFDLLDQGWFFSQKRPTRFIHGLLMIRSLLLHHGWNYKIKLTVVR